MIGFNPAPGIICGGREWDIGIDGAALALSPPRAWNPLKSSLAGGLFKMTPCVPRAYVFSLDHMEESSKKGAFMRATAQPQHCWNKRLICWPDWEIWQNLVGPQSWQCMRDLSSCLWNFFSCFIELLSSSSSSSSSFLSRSSNRSFFFIFALPFNGPAYWLDLPSFPCSWRSEYTSKLLQTLFETLSNSPVWDQPEC